MAIPERLLAAIGQLRAWIGAGQATTYSPVRFDVFRNVILVRMLWDDSSVVELREFGSLRVSPGVQQYWLPYCLGILSELRH